MLCCKENTPIFFINITVFITNCQKSGAKNLQMNLRSLKLLKIFLILVAIHSFCVGLGLMIIPLDYYDLFGFYDYSGNFFKIQAGVFHIVMSGAYVLAARDPVGNQVLILFSIFAKMIATVFLISYAVFIDMVWMVLASGIFDLLMGLVLIWFLKGLKNTQEVSYH